MATISEALDWLWTADDAAGMVHSDGEWHSWGEIRSAAERIDRDLTAAGCGAGGRVAVVLANSVGSVAALLAILRGGRTLVTVSPLQPAERRVADLATAGWTVDAGVVAQTAGRTPGDPAVAIEMQTSGTTGPPKRIPLSYKQLEASLAGPLRRVDRLDASPLTGDVGMVTVPIVHIGGLWALLEVLVTATPFALLERFTVDGWRAAVKQHRPVTTALPPAAVRSVFDSDVPPEDLRSLRFIHAGSSPVDPDLVDAFYERYGIPILIVYGATEFTGSIAGWSMKDFLTQWNTKRGSVGRAFPGVKLRVFEGRLQVATPRAGGSSDEWVTTSDLAHLDDDGFLYIDGRADDVIVRGGFKVAPETVVNALRRHHAVHDAAVAGLPDPRLGKIPYAAVELRNGADVTGEELREHCRTLLTPYEVPAAVVIVDELPRTAAMKVDRRRLLTLLAPYQPVG